MTVGHMRRATRRNHCGKLLPTAATPHLSLTRPRLWGELLSIRAKGTIDLTIYDDRSIVFHHDGSIDITAPIDSIKGFSLT